MAPTLEVSLSWMETGTNLCLRAIGGLHDDEFAQPSALPDWTRAHVIAHIDGNARALSNLVTWAAIGARTVASFTFFLARSYDARRS